MRLSILLVLILTTLTTGLQAQTQRADSLKAGVWKAENPTVKLQAILRLCEEHQNIYKDSLFFYVNLARNIAAGLYTTAGERANIKLFTAICFLRKEKSDSALAIIDETLADKSLSVQRGQDIYFRLMEQKINCFGDASNYKDALSILLQVVNEAEKKGDSLTAAINCNTIGVIEYNRDNLPNAFNWYQRGLAFATTGQQYLLPAAAININLADAYRWTGKTDSANSYIEKAILQSQQIENLFYLANAYRVQSTLYRDAKDNVTAEMLLLKSIALREKTEGNRSYSNETLALAIFYRKTGKVQKAIETLKAGLAFAATAGSLKKNRAEAKQTADILKVEFLQNLAQCYRDRNDLPNAISAMNDLVKAKDDFYNLNSAEAIADMQTRYEVQKKEATIALQELDITRKNILFYGSIGLLAVVVLISFTWFLGYRKRQNLKQSIAIENEKRNADLAVKNASEAERQRISRDLHDNLGIYAASLASGLHYVHTAPGDQSSVNAIQQLNEDAGSIISELNDTIWVLKKETLSLTAISDRIKLFFRRIAKSYPQIKMTVQEQIENEVDLSSAQAFHLYRIVQEAVTNSLRHSRCDTILVTISSNRAWQLLIEDNGTGMKASPAKPEGGNGLYNIRKRSQEANWQVSWLPREGTGTLVKISPTKIE